MQKIRVTYQNSWFLMPSQVQNFEFAFMVSKRGGEGVIQENVKNLYHITKFDKTYIFLF